jgi:PAS domain S-box-containing protein
MVLNREITAQIKSVLKENPQGLSITDIVAAVNINRNTAGRYLENLLVTGQVEMRQLGMAKIYTLSQRVPVSAVLSISSELILQLDKNLRIIFANDPFLSFVSVSSTDLFGKNIEYSQVFPVFEEVYSEFIDRIREGIAGTEWSGELALKERGIVFSCHIAPTVFDNGQKGVSVILDDISEKKRAEEALRASEGKLNAMLQSIPDHMSMLDKDLNILWANETAKQCFGKDIVGKKCYEVYHQRQNPCEPYPCLTLRAFQDGKIHRHETSVVDKNGQTISFECSANVALNDESGKPVAVLEISRDITERKRVEKKMQESEDRYRTLVEISPDAIIVHQNGTILYANPSALALLNVSHTSEIVGRKLFDFIHPGSRDAIAANIEKDIQGEKTPPMDTHMLRTDGSTVTVEGRGIGILFNGEPAVQVAIRDVTERKHTEEALILSEARYHRFADNSPDIIYRISLPEGRYEYISPAVTAISGYTPQEFYDDKLLLTKIIHPDWAYYFIEQWEQLLKGSVPKTYEYQIVHKNGDFRWINQRNMLVRDDQGLPVALEGIVTDITERKEGETALQLSEKRFRDLINTTADMVWQTDADSRFVYVSPQVEKILGYTADELVGQMPFQFLEPSSVDANRLAFNTAIKMHQDILLYESRWIDSDGNVVVLESHARQIYNSDGTCAGFLGIDRDITDR